MRAVEVRSGLGEERLRASEGERRKSQTSKRVSLDQAMYVWRYPRLS
jgi:hypothetical protein